MNRDDPATPSADDANPALRGLRVLAVEASEEERRNLGLLLRSLGMQPTLMAQAQTAIEELRQAAREGRPYSLLLFDPALRGSIVFRARRAQDDPLFAITPRIELASEARLDREAQEREPRLPKPVTRAALLEVLEQLLGRRDSLSAGPRVARSVSVSAPRVLAIVLDPVSALVMTRLVELAGGEPVIVGSSEEALALVGAVDVVLLDASRPEAAMQAASLRQARPGLRLVGIRDGSPESRGAAGFDDTLDETLDPEELRGRLMHPHAGQAAAPATPTQGPIFDRRQLASRLGDDDEVALRVLRRFVEDAGDRLRELARAAASGDRNDIRQQAHRIRGGLSWIGAEGAAGVAAAIEGLCREEGDTARAAELCQELGREIEGVVAAIRTAVELPTS